jgi:predicted lipoprotein with Yx(FWY)xxD motif
MGTVTTRGRRLERFGVVVAALAVIASAVAASALAFHGSTEAAGAGSVVKLGRTPLGRVLVDRRGRTLYLFEADQFGRSACSGKCAVAWPPLLTSGTPRAGAGVEAALLGTTKRADGKLQVTYQGYPVYTFFKDTKPGQAAGQGLDFFGGEWYVLDAQGRKIEDGRHGGDPASFAIRNTPLGRALTDDRGRTVYLFEGDKGSTSACYGACAANWPPVVTTGKPHAGSGVLAALLGTTKRKNGTLQVTYRGQPLYYFVKDHEAGETVGQELDAFGGEWYAVDRSGHSIEKADDNSGGGTDSTTTTPGNNGGGNDNGGGYTYP